jgi:hypothetical protein
MSLRTATVDREHRCPHLARLVPRPASMVEVGLSGVLMVDDSDTYRLKAAARELEPWSCTSSPGGWLRCANCWPSGTPAMTSL